ncbi:nicotinate-nucleotide--dimethylbenzimidazole phosphoribosyltransferase [Embleya sp. NPDC050154]|uniref:nicotinate-nucleotide--dimethylbenzimidazole phosphoribosyltransferase n=1 Tax=Embleya sp. NPDC050154 TaxID=3363988 RepID=UPI00379950E1
MAVPATPVAVEAPSEGSVAAPTEPTTPVETGTAGVQPAGSQVEAGGVDVVAPEAGASEAPGPSPAATVVGEPDVESAPAEPVAATATGEASAPVAQADSVTPTAPTEPTGPSVQPAPTAPAVSTGPTAPVEPATSVAQAVPVAPTAPTVAAWTEQAASVEPTGAEAASAESSAQDRGAEQSGEAPPVAEAVPVAAPAEQPAAGGAVEAVAEAAPVAVATGEASAEATPVAPADDASADSTPAALSNEAPVVGEPAGPTPAGPTTPSSAAEQVAEEIPAPQAAGEQQAPATAPEPVAGTTPTEAAPAAGPLTAGPAGSAVADPAVPRTSDEGTAMQGPEPTPTAEPDRQPQPAAVAGTGEIPRIPPPPADPVGALPIAPAQGGAAQAGPAAGEPVQGGPAQGGPAEEVAAEAAVPTGSTSTEPAGEAPAGDAPATGDDAAATDGDAAREPASATAVTVLLPAAERPVVAEPAAAADGSAPAPAEEPTPEAVAAESATPDASAPVQEPAEGSAEPEAAATSEQEPEPEVERGPAAPGYDDAAREAVHRVMRERRDVRAGFRPDPVPDDVLVRVLEAAHAAPSVGYSQPWDFVVIRSEETRVTVQELAQRQREAYATSLPKARAKQFLEIKVEAILETPVNIVVTVDSTRGGRHTLGRHTQPQMGPYSSALAVENLWLAARAEGLGVGWVSFFDERELATALGLPDHIDVVAYLCVGYVDAFPDEPELATSGWAKARPLSWVVHEETYGRRGLPGEEPVSLLDETLHSVRPLDAKALGAAWEHQRVMTKPPGSLGILETIGAQLSGLARTFPPPIPEPAAVAVFAADHGVHAQGVSPWPQEVTAQMVGNFLAGGAVVNAFAKQIGVEVCVVDVGVATELPQASGLLPRRIRPGTGDMTQGLAMTREEAVAAIEVGIETARDLVTAGNRGLLTGDMGIANTTASAALISVFTGMDVAEVTGRGTGIDDATHRRKIEVVKAALARHEPDPGDPIGVLAAVGGLEHAAIAGYIIGAAALRVPVVLDGVIAGAAALVAQAIAPEAIQACVAGHRSAEPGHAAALAKLSLRPLVELEMRLGEGTGAVLALPLVQSAVRVLHDVATFDSAGVSGKTD